jgi:hypothetical protein
VADPAGERTCQAQPGTFAVGSGADGQFAQCWRTPRRRLRSACVVAVNGSVVTTTTFLADPSCRC